MYCVFGRDSVRDESIDNALESQSSVIVSYFLAGNTRPDDPVGVKNLGSIGYHGGAKITEGRDLTYLLARGLLFDRRLRKVSEEKASVNPIWQPVVDGFGDTIYHRFDIGVQKHNGCSNDGIVRATTDLVKTVGSIPLAVFAKNGGLPGLLETALFPVLKDLGAQVP